MFTMTYKWLSINFEVTRDVTDEEKELIERFEKERRLSIKECKPVENK